MPGGRQQGFSGGRSALSRGGQGESPTFRRIILSRGPDHFKKPGKNPPRGSPRKGKKPRGGTLGAIGGQVGAGPKKKPGPRVCRKKKKNKKNGVSRGSWLFGGTGTSPRGSRVRPGGRGGDAHFPLSVADRGAGNDSAFWPNRPPPLSFSAGKPGGKQFIFGS